jgi:hypothetical protein
MQDSAAASPDDDLCPCNLIASGVRRMGEAILLQPGRPRETLPLRGNEQDIDVPRLFGAEHHQRVDDDAIRSLVRARRNDHVEQPLGNLSWDIQCPGQEHQLGSLRPQNGQHFGQLFAITQLIGVDEDQIPLAPQLVGKLNKDETGKHHTQRFVAGLVAVFPRGQGMWNEVGDTHTGCDAYT